MPVREYRTKIGWQPARMEKGKYEMSDKNTTVTKAETLAALKNPGELYVIMSAVTKLPFVVCDDETYDDEVLLYYRSEDAKERARKLMEEKYLTAVAKLETKQLLPFYTSLYTLGVNCLSVNSGTDTQINIQLGDLVVRKQPDQMPEGKKLVENPALHLTAIYLMQELRRQETPQMTEQIKELQEELLAHYVKGTYLIALGEDGKAPVLKQKNGDIYQPVFTDVLEFQRFGRGKKMRLVIVDSNKIQEILAPEAKGIVINPLGVNIQLQVTRKKKPAADA